MEAEAERSVALVPVLLVARRACDKPQIKRIYTQSCCKCGVVIMLKVTKGHLEFAEYFLHVARRRGTGSEVSAEFRRQQIRFQVD